MYLRGFVIIIVVVIILPVGDVETAEVNDSARLHLATFFFPLNKAIIESLLTLRELEL